MTIHYFAADGHYGNARQLVVVDTSDWTEDEWEDVDNAPEGERGSIALQLSGGKMKPTTQLALPLVFPDGAAYPHNHG